MNHRSHPCMYPRRARKQTIPRARSSDPVAQRDAPSYTCCVLAFLLATIASIHTTMGLSLSRLYSSLGALARWGKEKEVRILMVGLDSAGKVSRLVRSVVVGARGWEFGAVLFSVSGEGSYQGRRSEMMSDRTRLRERKGKRQSLYNAYSRVRYAGAVVRLYGTLGGVCTTESLWLASTRFSVDLTNAVTTEIDTQHEATHFSKKSVFRARLVFWMASR